MFPWVLSLGLTKQLNLLRRMGYGRYYCASCRFEFQHHNVAVVAHMSQCGTGNNVMLLDEMSQSLLAVMMGCCDEERRLICPFPTHPPHPTYTLTIYYSDGPRTFNRTMRLPMPWEGHLARSFWVIQFLLDTGADGWMGLKWIPCKYIANGT